MRILIPVLGLLLAPLALAHDNAVEGTVLAGAGQPILAGVDHERHPIPHEATGIRVLAGDARYALLDNCPSDMACATVFVVPCLAVYADAGDVNVVYSFAWATGADEDVRFGDMPHVFLPTPEDPTEPRTGELPEDPFELLADRCR